MIISGVILLEIDNSFKHYHCNLHLFLVTGDVLSCLLELNERQKKTVEVIVGRSLGAAEKAKVVYKG